MARVLIICVDRDNDLGEKAGIKGPVIGVRACKSAANKLLLADPSESDANAIFAAIKLKKSLKNSQVVVLTGDRQLGIKSDMELRRQLEEVLRKTKAKEAIVVSDGLSDEFVIPIIASYLPIASVQRVVVRQSERIETSYYILKSYWRELLQKPELARVVLGLPAIALLILAIFGSAGISLILACIGVYLLVKAFQLESLLASFSHELASTLKRGKAAFLLYFASLILAASGFFLGYRASEAIANAYTRFLLALHEALPYLAFASFLFLTAKVIERKLRKLVYSRLVAIAFGLALISYNAIELVLFPTVGYQKLFLAIIVSVAAISFVAILEKVKG